MIDANARTCRQVGGQIGHVVSNSEAINDNGERFVQLLIDSDMIALNTYWNCGHTWRSPHGPTARLDYVCAPRWLLPAVTSCD
eukprot:13872458-Heterocapsa_arctica.AAC.1